VVSGEFDQKARGDGTRNVTYTVDRMKNASTVTLDYEGASSDTAFRRTALFEGGSAVAVGVEPGTRITLVASNDCGRRTTVETYTVY
jgi:hypothetical protein